MENPVIVADSPGFCFFVLILFYTAFLTQKRTQNCVSAVAAYGKGNRSRISPTVTSRLPWRPPKDWCQRLALVVRIEV